MLRINSANNTALLPAPLADVNAPGFFVNNPGAGPGTVLSGDWANRVQEEIVAPILAAGIALDGSKNDQLLAALQLIRGFQAFVVNGNFIVPAGIIRVTSLVWGGGGAGGGTSSGGGAGGGGFALKRCTVTPGQTIAVTVSPQASPGPPANPGGTSSFGAFCSATGGAIGQDAGAGGVGGVGVGGDLNLQGAPGGISPTAGIPGYGGAAPFGGGGVGRDSMGGTPGGGGGGGIDFNGSNGAPGLVVALW
jgi:hypothetical protein